jgi:xylan 1,4-beta-xylosidase
VRISLVIVMAWLGSTAMAEVSNVTPSTASPLRKVVVDAGSSAGTLRSLQGVNGAPLPNVHKPLDFTFGGWNMPGEIDATEGYRRARIDLVRTHDSYGPGDIDSRFGPCSGMPDVMAWAHRDVLSMFPDPNADPGDPKSYHFAPTDQLIASIKSVGAEVMFRLGRSECSNVDPPADFDRYAAVVKHIVMHYNQGWANGFRHGIRYWEVWNEPDLSTLFWGGTPDQYFELYARIARAVKEADPEVLVGGPALAKPNNAMPYRDGFLEYVRARQLPLDFYSWHWYATDFNDPLDVVRIGRDVRALLDAHGFTKTLSVLNEWNYGLMEPWPHDLQRAGFIASTLIYMQDAPIDVSALYRADNVFGKDGATPDKVRQMLIAFGRMKDTPARLQAEGADLDGFAVQAGRSADGRTLQVLIANYEIPAEFRGPRSTPNVLRVFDVTLLERRSVMYQNNSGYDLTIDNLMPAREYLVERFRISDDSDFALVDSTTQVGPRVHLQARLPPPGIELVVLKVVDARTVRQ